MTDGLTYETHTSSSVATSRGEISGVKYMIRALRYSNNFSTIIDTRDGYRGEGHFTAYVQIDENLLTDEELEGYAHWGYTWMYPSEWATGEKCDPGMCIAGWDYAHLNDELWVYDDVLREVMEFIEKYKERMECQKN